MDPVIKINRNQMCKKHNQELKYWDKRKNQGPYCLICVEENLDLEPYEQHIDGLEAIIQEQANSCDVNIQFFKKWCDRILYYKAELLSSLDKFIQGIDAELKIIEKFKDELFQNSTVHQQSKDNIDMNGQHFFKQRDEMKAQLQQQLQDFQKSLVNNLTELINQLPQKPQLPEMNNKETQIEQLRIEYDLVKADFKNVEEWCQSFAFNKEGNILFAACEKEIVVYQFNKGIIDEKQKLTGHKQNVSCLYFMKQTNSLVSGSEDGLIIIWEQNNNKWFSKTQLKNHHQDKVYCLIMNKNEDLMITSSLDKTIKFWNKNNSQWNVQQNFATYSEVYEISLNEEENTLISCVKKQVYILKKQVNQEWRIFQVINIDSCILCFTFKDQFILQSYDSDKIEIYDYNKSQGQFKKVQEVQNQKYEEDFEFFSCQYLQAQKIVLIKFGRQLSIFNIDSINQYQLIYNNTFADDRLFGRLSDDGEYLVTWDDSNKLIYIQERSKGK